MSVARQKSRRLFAAGLILMVAGIYASPGRSVQLAPVATDSRTGIAIDGFDPVAYFTADGPKQGRPDIEYRLAGVTWRFENDGNRAAFADHPEVYAPQFGGYDPVAIARGVSVPGHPLTWLVFGERLYLFYDDKARADFVAGPVRTIGAAQRRWADVQRTLP